MNGAGEGIADGEDDQEGDDRAGRQCDPAKAEAGLNPGPVLQQIGSLGAPDHEEDRDRQHDEAEPDQQRRKPLARAFLATLQHVEKVGDEILQDD